MGAASPSPTSGTSGCSTSSSAARFADVRTISSPLLEETSIQGARGVLINISGGHDLTLHEVAEAARIISGMVIDPTLDEAMKVTVIATGFDRQGEDRPRPPMPQMNVTRPTPAPSLASLPINDRGDRGDRAERPEEPEKAQVDVPFYRKAIAHVRGDDPNGFGPNWSNVDDYDIPTVLRKQMD